MNPLRDSASEGVRGCPTLLERRVQAMTQVERLEDSIGKQRWFGKVR